MKQHLMQVVEIRDEYEWRDCQDEREQGKNIKLKLYAGFAPQISEDVVVILDNANYLKQDFL